VHGLPAYVSTFDAATDQGTLRGRVGFVSYDGKLYRILGYTPAARFATYDGEFTAAIESFAPLRDQRYLSVEPKRIDLVTLDREMALPDFARAYPSTVEVGTLGLINGIASGGSLARGEMAKRVVGGRLPD
jgi:predicted Zn-dependent protease